MRRKNHQETSPEDEEFSKFLGMLSSIIDDVSKGGGNSQEGRSTESVILEKSLAITLGLAAGVIVSAVQNRRSLKKRVDSLETRVSRLEKEGME